MHRRRNLLISAEQQTGFKLQTIILVRYQVTGHFNMDVKASSGCWRNCIFCCLVSDVPSSVAPHSLDVCDGGFLRCGQKYVQL